MKGSVRALIYVCVKVALMVVLEGLLMISGKKIIDNGVLVRLHQKSLCFVSIYLLLGFMLVCIDMKKFLENVDFYHYKN